MSKNQVLAILRNPKVPREPLPTIGKTKPPKWNPSRWDELHARRAALPGVIKDLTEGRTIRDDGSIEEGGEVRCRREDCPDYNGCSRTNLFPTGICPRNSLDKLAALIDPASFGTATPEIVDDTPPEEGEDWQTVLDTDPLEEGYEFEDLPDEDDPPTRGDDDDWDNRYYMD